MVRRDRERKSGIGGKIVGLAIINIIPLAGLAWWVWALTTGRTSLDDLPEGIGRNAIHFGIAVLLLMVCASGLLPFAHGLAKGLRGRLRYSAEMRRQGGALRKIWECLLWPFRALLWAIFALLRLGLLLLCLALVAAAVLFIVRFFEPTALESQLRVEEHMQQGLDWLRRRFPG